MHDFDMVRWLTGQEVVEVCVLGANLTEAAGFAVAAAPGGGFVTRFAAAYRAEMRRFAELAAGRGDNPREVRDAVAALRVADAATVSRLENRPVLVSQD